MALNHCTQAEIRDCEIARNAYFGILVTESSNISITGNFIEGDDRSGVMIEFLYRGSENTNVIDNQIQFNNGFCVEAFAARSTKVSGNQYTSNKLAEEKISDEKYIIMK